MAALVAVALMASACGGDEDDTTEQDDPVAAAEARVEEAESGLADSEEALVAAREQFCVDAESYLDVLDRYGKLFTDDAATVGDVQTLGADLVEPRETVSASVSEVEEAKTALEEAGQELAEAEVALAEAIAIASSVPVDSTTPATTTTTTLVPPATIDRVQQAEDDLARTGEGISETTPLTEATAEYNSAAFALQIAWLKLLFDAGCFSDEQEADALEQVTAYTTTLQTELQLVGYYDGPIDGIYGPATVDGVKRLQADSGLRETGFVDMATARALDDLLAELDLQTATADLTRTASVQTVLTLTGFWNGPIDGVWNDELTAALQAFQTALGIEPTGVVDTATLAAFEQALAELQAPPTPETAPPDTTTPEAAPPETATPEAAPPETAPADTTTPETTDADPGADDDETLLVADSALGPILTAGDGMTVYLYTPDGQGGTPTCIDACAEAWPPVTAGDANPPTGGAGVDASRLGTAEHPTAGTQVTYNDWPLYFFAGDAVPGDTTGQGQGGVWYVLDPAGDAIGAAG